MIEEIIASYVKNVWKRDKLPIDQKALLRYSNGNGDAFV